MGKNKLSKFAEMAEFPHVFEPEVNATYNSDFYMKGNWSKEFFKNNNPIVLELGCGKGEYSVKLAELFPEKNFIGTDIKGARMWRGAKTSSEKRMKNIAFLRTRIEMIESFFSGNEIDEIWITFPDPQLKKKRWKKRLTSAVFLNSYQNFLKENSLIHLKTDSQELHHFTIELAKQNNLDILECTTDVYSESYADEILTIKTHYEELFSERGKKITYLKFRIPNKQILKDPEIDEDTE